MPLADAETNASQISTTQIWAIAPSPCQSQYVPKAISSEQHSDGCIWLAMDDFLLVSYTDLGLVRTVIDKPLMLAES